MKGLDVADFGALIKLKAIHYSPVQNLGSLLQWSIQSSQAQDNARPDLEKENSSKV